MKLFVILKLAAGLSVSGITDIHLLKGEREVPFNAIGAKFNSPMADSEVFLPLPSASYSNTDSYSPSIDGEITYLPPFFGAENIFQGLKSQHNLKIYVEKSDLDMSLTSQQMIVQDVQIQEWTDASQPTCPQGYQPAGNITADLPLELGCKKLGLCVKKVLTRLLKEHDTLISGIALSTNQSFPSSKALNYFSESPDLYSGCKNKTWMGSVELAIGRIPVFPRFQEQSSTEKRDLVSKFAPLIFIHSKEKYFPSSVTQLLDGSTRVFEQGNWHLNAKAPIPADSQNFSDPYWFGNPNLDQVPVYAFYIERSPNVTDIVYSTVFPFNSGKKIPLALDFVFDNHVADLEHTAVRLINGVPTTWFVQTHSFSNYFYFNSPELSRTGTQTHVWCAVGSHGYWEKPGTHQYLVAGGGLVKLTDECDSGHLWDSRLNLEVIDLNLKKPLDGNKEINEWIHLFDSDGISDPKLGNQDSRSGPVLQWGQIDKKGCIAGQCLLERAPIGIPHKAWYSLGSTGLQD